MTWVASNTLVREFEFICHCDPALDSESESFEEQYRLYRDRGDAALLPVKSNQVPAVWTLRHLNPRVVAKTAQLQSEAKFAESLVIAAQYAIKAVRGISTESGGDFKVETVRCNEMRCPMASDDTLSQILAFGPSVLVEIGMRALNLNPLS